MATATPVPISCFVLRDSMSFRLVEKSTNCKLSYLVALWALKNSNLIGKRLRKLRTERELSQEGLAAACQRLGWDASREIINHIEMQIRLVRDYEVVALAKALDADPSDLLPSEREAFARLAK